MCIKILEDIGKISSAEYNFLLKGGVVLDRKNQLDNPCPSELFLPIKSVHKFTCVITYIIGRLTMGKGRKLKY